MASKLTKRKLLQLIKIVDDLQEFSVSMNLHVPHELYEEIKTMKIFPHEEFHPTILKSNNRGFYVGVFDRSLP